MDRLEFKQRAAIAIMAAKIGAAESRGEAPDADISAREAVEAALCLSYAWRDAGAGAAEESKVAE